MTLALRTAVFWTVIMGSVAASGGVFAQADHGTLTGRVTDPDGRPITGATITVTGSAAPAPRTCLVSPGGTYLVADLPPGADYSVEVDAPGFSRVKRARLRIALGATTTLDVALAREGGSIQVVARPPELSLRQTSLWGQVTEKELDLLPLERSYRASFLLLPTVLTAGMGGNPAAAGATGGENLYVIDGIRVNDPVMGTVGTNLNFNFVREVQGVAAGQDADSIASTGGLFSVLTRAGTDEFHGQVFLYGTGDAWAVRPQPTDRAALGPSPFSAFDFGFDFSGPLARDRAWFFVGYNPSTYSRQAEGTYATTYVNGSSPAAGAVYHIPFDDDLRIRDDYWSLKVTARPAADQSLEFSLFGDPSRRYLDEGYAVAAHPEATWTRRYQGGFSGALKWFATWSPRAFSEVTLGRTEAELDLVPWDAAGYAAAQIFSYDWWPVVNVGRGMGVYTEDRRGTTQLGARVTWLAGRHEIAAGGDWEDLDWRNTTAFTGGAQWIVSGGTGPPLSGNPRDYANWYVTTQENPYSHEKGRYSSLFLQDRWAPTDNLSLTMGLRWESDQVFPERGAPLQLNALSPRLGVAWDFTGSGKGKLFAHWGQYHERLPIYMAQTMDPGHSYYLDFWGDHGNQYMGRFTYLDIPATVAPGTRSPYDEEWVAGVTCQVAPDAVLGLTAVFRRLGRVLEDVMYPDAGGNFNAVIMNPGSGQWPAQMAAWASQVPDYQPFPAPVRNYEGYTLSFQKRMRDGWFLNAEYTWSRLRGNCEGGSGGYGTDGYAPFVSSAYDYPWALYNRFRYGDLPQDRPNELKVQAGCESRAGLSFGALLDCVSGRPISQTMSLPIQEAMGGTMFVSPRGSAGRLPTLWHLDLRAQYAIPVGRARLAVVLDLFNVTNRQAATAVEESYYLPPMTIQDVLTGNLRRNPRWGQVTSRQDGRYARLGLKLSF